MHRDINPQSAKRHLCELEAESCAFIVCHFLGLDTSKYSFAYLANWADNPSELLPAAEKASKVAEQLLETLRGLFFSFSCWSNTNLINSSNYAILLL